MLLTFEEYKNEAISYLKPQDNFFKQMSIVTCGIAGEVGELIEELNDEWCNGEKVILEVGDVAFYLAALSHLQQMRIDTHLLHIEGYALTMTRNYAFVHLIQHSLALCEKLKKLLDRNSSKFEYTDITLGITYLTRLLPGESSLTECLMLNLEKLEERSKAKGHPAYGLGGKQWHLKLT